MKSKLSSGIRTGIRMIFLAAVLWLSFLAFYQTCYLTADVTETTYFVRGHFLINILAVLIWAGLLSLLSGFSPVKTFGRKIETDDKLFWGCKYTLLGCLSVIAVVWVTATRLRPDNADQRCIMMAASGLRNGQYWMFMPGEYVSRYPNQIGLVTLCYLFSFLFGCDNYLAFQLCNVIALAFIYKELSELGGRFGLKRPGQLAVIFMGILFIPLILYCSFVYGNLMGLACALIAVKHELIFLEKGKKQNAAISAAAIMLAVMIKSNYLIALTAMILYAGIEFIRKPEVKKILYLILVCFLTAAQFFASKALIEKKAGVSMDQGISAWASVATGMTGTGWFSGYETDSYLESGGNTAVQAQMAKAVVRDRVSYFVRHYGEAARFFSEKTASGWNNPTFQGFWVVQVMDGAEDLSGAASELISIRGADRAAAFLKQMQLIVLIGAVLGVVFALVRGEDSEAEIILLYFLGGLIFHLFWEMKGQYTVTYYVTLFPVAVKGWGELTEKLSALKQKNRIPSESGGRRAVNRVLFLAEAAVVGILLFVLYGNGRGVYLGKDTKGYTGYVKAHSSERVLEEGRWLFHAKEGEDYLLWSENGAAITVFSVDSGITPENVITVKNRGNASYGYFNAEEAGDAQSWLIRFVDEDTVCVFFGELTSQCLTCNLDKKSVGLERYRGGDDQLWTVEKVSD